MATRRKTASRGFVNNIILESLLSGDKYGYEIIKEVEEKSNGKIVLKQPSLYSSLKRFETKGFITSYWGDSDIGGRRHYYTITETGRNYYNKTINKNYELSKEDDEEIINSQETEQLVFNSPEQIESPEQIKNVDDIINSNNNSSLNETEEYDIFAKQNTKAAEIFTDNNNVDDEDYNIFEILEKPSLSQSEKHEIQEKPIESLATFKETPIQVDMFTENKEYNEINKEESIDIENIQQLKLNDTATESNNNLVQDKKDIPLIKEQPHEFFSWEDLKRKQAANTTATNIEENETKPIKNQVVMDEFGILKISDSEEEKSTPIKNQKIFDNVGDRIEYKDPVVKQPIKIVKQIAEPELTEQEREVINKKFTQKFDEIITHKSIEQPKEIDYKNILGDLLATEEGIKENPYEEEIPEEIIDQAITQTQNYNNLQQQNVSSFEDGFKFKPFVNNKDEQSKQTNFVLTNKVKLKFGIFMFVLMILQISTLFIVLKTQNLLYTTDYIFYGLAYGLALIILLYCVIVYLVAPDKRKSNSFKLSYSVIFGIILFLAACALTYALNTFGGLNNSNVTLFSTKILLPIILSINFILTPLVYKMILLDKKVY